MRKKLTLSISILFAALLLGGCSKEQTQLQTNSQKNIEESHLSKNEQLDKNVQNSLSLAARKPTNQQNMQEQNIDLSLNEKYKGAILHTSHGDIKVSFFTEKSPKTVANFLTLSSNNFYDGTRFHRIIKDFMIQAGDPNSKDKALSNSWGTGGPGYSFEDEINDEELVKGSLAMANSGPNTNGSQFFIVSAEETPWLNGKHTNFGKVEEGMDVIEKIENLKTGPKDQPVEDVVVNSIELIEK